MVGTSGRSGQRCSEHTASPFIEPDLMWPTEGATEPEQICTVPASSASTASPPPLNTTSSRFGSFSFTFNSAICNCGVVPIGGTEALNFSGLERARPTKVLHRLRRQIGLDQKDVRRAADVADRDEILHRIERQRIVEAGIDRERGGAEQERVAVRIGMGDIFHAEIAAGAAAVLDDESLSGRLLQGRRDQAADNVGGTARRIGDDEFDRPVGIGGKG